MIQIAEKPAPLADVASARDAQVSGRLHGVGMADIAAPIQIGAQLLPARIDASVNLLDPAARGIHMSRLYALVNGVAERGPLTPQVLKALLDEMLKSHVDLSDRAALEIRFELLLKRRALASGLLGWRSYPVKLSALSDAHGYRIELEVEVLYSSTCPSSAALARQLVKAEFERTFAQQGPVDAAQVASWLESQAGMAATPHAQRSSAQVRVTLDLGASDLPIEALIDLVEASLKTPVQAAVKRADEQAFALLNGHNLMFCEDAARRLQAALLTKAFEDFSVRVSHFESLHAHNAVASARKRLSSAPADP